MKKKNEEYVQWSYDIIQNAYLNKPEDLTAQDNTYMNYLLPFSYDYFGPTNPMLVFGGHTLNDIPNQKFLTIRDGIIPTSIFFRDISPSTFKGEVLIHKDLWYTVPDAWREKVKYFNIVSKYQYDSTHLPKKIFIAGALNTVLADPDELDSMIKELRDGIGKENLKKIEVFAYFPNKRTDLWGNWEEENVLRFSASLFKNLKVDLKVPEWKLIHSENDYSDTLYYEVNAGALIKDSYLTHFTLARGAGLLKPKRKKIDRFFSVKSQVRLSLYHQMDILELDYAHLGPYLDPKSDKHFNYFRKMIEASTKNKKINFKWEKWYATYLKRFYRDNKSRLMEQEILSFYSE